MVDDLPDWLTPDDLPDWLTLEAALADVRRKTNEQMRKQWFEEKRAELCSRKIDNLPINDPSDWRFGFHLHTRWNVDIAGLKSLVVEKGLPLWFTTEHFDVDLLKSLIQDKGLLTTEPFKEAAWICDPWRFLDEAMPKDMVVRVAFGLFRFDDVTFFEKRHGLRDTTTAYWHTSDELRERWMMKNSRFRSLNDDGDLGTLPKYNFVAHEGVTECDSTFLPTSNFLFGETMWVKYPSFVRTRDLPDFEKGNGKRLRLKINTVDGRLRAYALLADWYGTKDSPTKTDAKRFLEQQGLHFSDRHFYRIIADWEEATGNSFRQQRGPTEPPTAGSAKPPVF